MPITKFRKTVIDDLQIESLLRVNQVTKLVATPTVTLNVSTSNNFEITLGTNCTVVLTGYSPFEPGRSSCQVRIILTQDTTGNRIVTWPANVTMPTTTIVKTANTYTSILLITVDGGVNWVATVEYTGGLKQYVPVPPDPNLIQKTPYFIGARRLINGSDDTLYTHASTISGDLLVQVACPWNGNLPPNWNMLIDGTNDAPSYYGMKVGIFWKFATANGVTPIETAVMDPSFNSVTPSPFVAAVYSYRNVHPVSPWGTYEKSITPENSANVVAPTLNYNVNAASLRVGYIHNRSEAAVTAPAGTVIDAMAGPNDYFWSYASLYSFRQNSIDRLALIFPKTSRVTTPSSLHNNAFKSYAFDGEMRGITLGKDENVTYANRIIIHCENMDMRNTMPGLNTYIAGYPNQNVLAADANPAVPTSTKAITIRKNGVRYVDLLSPLLAAGVDDFTIEFYFKFAATPDPDVGIVSSMPLYDGVNKTNGFLIATTSGSATSMGLAFSVGRKQTGASVKITSTVNINTTVYNHCSLCRQGARIFAHVNGTPAGAALMSLTADNFELTNVIARYGHMYNNASLNSCDVLIDEIRYVKGTAIYTEGTAYTRPSQVN